MLNPYIAGAPVVEASMFFGREDVFGWIERSLEGKFVNHILVLHGQRRVGKTSVLKQIPNFLTDKYIQVFFDLQGRTGTSLDRFLWWLASEITRTLKREHDILIPKPDRKEFEDTEYLINEFLPGVRAMLGDYQLLLTFDEFDSLDRPEIQETLAHPLIAYLRRLIEADWLNFIFSIGSSGDKLENMQASYTDFFKTALYRKISFLTNDDIQHLVTKPVEGLIQYEKIAVRRIGEITSGHPYFTQLMCHELFSRCQKTGARTITADDVEDVLEDVVERGTVNLKFVWDEASDLEKWILAILAQMDGGDNKELTKGLIAQHVRFSESDMNSAVIHLRDKDVITKDNRFVIHLMRLWLVANRPTDRVREELAEVNPIANRYIEIGDEYRERGEKRQAIESYQQALNANPGNLKAQINIASVCLDQKDYEEAAAAFELALKIDDEDVVVKTGYCAANLALGDAAFERNEIELAIALYQKILVANAAHADARQRLAMIYGGQAERQLDAGNDDKALRLFNQAMELTPEDEQLSTRYQDVLAQNKAKVTAKRLEKAEAATKAGNWMEAIRAWDGYLELDPDDKVMAEERLQYVRKFAKIEADYSEAQQAIRGKLYGRAVELLQGIIAQDPSYKSTPRLLAEAVEANNTAPTWKRPWLLPVIGALIFLGVGILFGPRLWKSASSAIQDWSLQKANNIVLTATPKINPEEVSGVETLSPEVKLPVNVLDYLIVAQPSLEDDFSTLDTKWGSLEVRDGALVYDAGAGEEYVGPSQGFSGRNFAIRYIFTVLDKRGEANNFGVRFREYPDANLYYQFTMSDENNNALLSYHPASGDLEILGETQVVIEENTPYEIVIIAIEKQFQVYLDGNLIISADDDRLEGTTTGNDLWFKGAKIVAVDNLKYWNLDDKNVDFSSSREYGESYRSILSYIEYKTPTFVDDFSTVKADWGAVIVDGETRNENLADYIAYEALVLNTGQQGWESLFLGDLDGNTPLQGTNFVIQFDFLGGFESNEGSGLTLNFRGTDSKEYNRFSMSNYGGASPRWYFTVVHSDGSEDVVESGYANLDLGGDEGSQVRFIAYGPDVAFFLNDKLQAEFQQTQVVGNNQNFGFNLGTLHVEGIVDNVKFWNLDGVEFSTTSNTPASSSDIIEQVLSYKDSTPPSFEDDFSTTNNAWGNTSNGLDISNNVQFGVLTIPEYIESGISFPTNSIFNANNFVLQFDYNYARWEPYTNVKRVAVQFRNLEILFSNYHGDWTLYENGESIATSEIYSYSPSLDNTLLIVCYENILAVYMNGELLYSNSETTLSGSENRIVVYGGENLQWNMQFDNVKFWNLDGVEFSPMTITGSPTVLPLTHTPRPTPTVTPIPAWVPDFVEPMLERITDVTPDFLEDFSNPQGGWEMVVGADGSFQIEDGVARINVNKEEGSHIRNETVDSLADRDFIMEMDAKVVEGEAAIDLWTHFIFDENPSDSKNVGFLGQPAESSWSVTIDSAQGRNSIGGKGSISPVGQYTHITIILTDQKVAFSLNGNPIAYFEDPFLDESASGFHFNCDGMSTGGICEFDNIKIWTLP